MSHSRTVPVLPIGEGFFALFFGSSEGFFNEL